MPRKLAKVPAVDVRAVLDRAREEGRLRDGVPTRAEEEAEFERAVFPIYAEMLLALARAKRSDVFFPMLRACRKTVGGRDGSGRMEALAAFLASVDGVTTEGLVLVAMYLLPTIAPWLPLKGPREPRLPHPSRRDPASFEALHATYKTALEPDAAEIRRQLQGLKPRAVDPIATMLFDMARKVVEGKPGWVAPNGLRSKKVRDHARFLWKMFPRAVELPERRDDPLKYGRQLVECAARCLGLSGDAVKNLFAAERNRTHRVKARRRRSLSRVTS